MEGQRCGTKLWTLMGTCGTGVLLRLFANKGSDGALRCASGIRERTLQNLRSPLLPTLLAEADATSVFSLSLA
jgi:hypothetical protein